MASNGLCPKCKSGKEEEVIDGGIKMTVHCEGEFMAREETTYETKYDHSTFYCDNTRCTDYEKEI